MRNPTILSPRIMLLSTRLLFSLSLLYPIASAFPVDTNVESSTSPDICGPADWKTIILFYLLNYGAHAFTVVNLPGETTGQKIYWSILALLLPYSGIGKACQTISRGLLSPANPLKRALYAGALCEVISNRLVHFPDTFELREKKIHGRVLKPDGYAFRVITGQIEFEKYQAKQGGEQATNHLASNYDILKTVIAIIQLVFACLTLYRSKGNQLEIYGYAAFGLTVAQYAVMSFVNLLANLVTPHYPTVYMVRTEMMAKAESQGGKFDGVVAEIHGQPDANPKIIARGMKILMILIAVLAVAAPYCIIASMTRFNPANSTKAQRGWTMSWIVVSQMFGFFYGWMGAVTFTQLNSKWFIALTCPAVPLYWLILKAIGCCVGWSSKASWFGLRSMFGLRSFTTLVMAAPMIGAFVVVGQMLAAHGSCSAVAI